MEGADAVGKNTLTDGLLAWVEESEQQAIKISFPRYETPVGKLIKDHLTNKIFLEAAAGVVSVDIEAANNLMFQCLMLADKVDAAALIRKELATGKTVILDRYWQSAYVYGSTDHLDSEWLLRTHDVLPQADVNILLDLPEEEASRRRPQYRDRYEQNREKMAAVRLGYLSLWSQKNWDIIDASLPPETVLNLAKELVKKVS